MKQTNFPRLLQPFRLGDYDTLISIANGDTFYGSVLVEAVYKLCIFSSQGRLLHQSQHSIKPYEKIIISLAGLDMDCTHGLFFLEKISGITNGHYYTTFMHLKQNSSFIVHSHQVFDSKDIPSSRRFYLSLLNMLSFPFVPSLKSMRKIAIPPIGNLVNNKLEIFAYNRANTSDRLYISLVDKAERIYSHSLLLAGHHSIIISVSDLFKVDNLDVSSIYLKPMNGSASAKPLIFHYSHDNKLISLHHA